MAYNTTSVDNVTSLGEWYTNINTTANGMPAVGFLVILWFAVYVYSTNRNLPPGEAILASSFSSGLISGLMLFQGLVSQNVVMVFGTLVVASIVYLMMR